MRTLSRGTCGLALSLLVTSGCTLLEGLPAFGGASPEPVPSPSERTVPRPVAPEPAPDAYTAADLEPISDPGVDVIRSVQAALNERGFAVGRPDGMIGAQTLRGLRLFKVARRMPVNDAITPVLLTELEVP